MDVLSWSITDEKYKDQHTFEAPTVEFKEKVLDMVKKRMKEAKEKNEQQSEGTKEQPLRQGNQPYSPFLFIIYSGI